MIADTLEQSLFEPFGSDSHLDEMARYHLGTGGKRLRGWLALGESERLKVPKTRALRWAAACELLHNATLIHDDLQDNDPLRRGQASVWKAFGANQAINLGDYFIFRCFELVAAGPCASVLVQAAIHLVRGQSQEMEIKKVSPQRLWETYLDVAALKTGTLLQAPSEGIQVLAGIAPEEAQAATRPWCDLGVAYQIDDDLNDFLGKKAGQDPCKDLQEQKVNAIVAWLAREPEHHDLISSYLSADKGSASHQQTIEAIRECASDNCKELAAVGHGYADGFIQNIPESPAKSRILKFFQASSLKAEEPKHANV